MGLGPGNDYGSVHRCAGNKTLYNVEVTHMLSDGHNLMLNSREEHRLWMIFKDLSEHKPYYFGDSEEELILQKWIDSMFSAIEEARKKPYNTVKI